MLCLVQPLLVAVNRSANLPRFFRSFLTLTNVEVRKSLDDMLYHMIHMIHTAMACLDMTNSLLININISTASPMHSVV